MQGTPSPLRDLSRRERQIMEIVYARGRATAAEVHARIPETPSATAVRTMLRTLEEKGHLRHEQDGPRHVYMPTVPQKTARQRALRSLMGTFFGGSAREVVAALLDLSERELSEAERAEIAALILQSRRQGK